MIIFGLATGFIVGFCLLLSIGIIPTTTSSTVLNWSLFILPILFGGIVGKLYELKKDVALLRKFILHFFYYNKWQECIDNRLTMQASNLDRAFQQSVLLQSGGLKALGCLHENMSEESRQKVFEEKRVIIQKRIDEEKKNFWEIYDLAETFSMKFTLKDMTKKPRTYKSYLKT